MLNFKVLGIGLGVVFLAVILLLYIVDNVARLQVRCETDKSLNICKIDTMSVVLLLGLLMMGGLVIVVGATAYVMISMASGLSYVKHKGS